MNLTISMACYDDYDGVYFTVQSLRMHHRLPDATEFLVLDNNPGGAHSAALAKFAKDIPGMRVVPVEDRKSSWVKYDAFALAQGEVLLGLDCHVLLQSGFVERMMEHWRAHPESRDMLTGPLLYNNLRATSAKMSPQWRGHDFGTWADDPDAMRAGVPFEIPMQGMGCFSLQRGGFVTVNPAFRGFGAEEWYMAEKVRQNGGRVLCHPAMGWNHRFGWPAPRFPLRATDKLRNYLTGWLELYGSHEHPRIVEMMEHWHAVPAFAPVPARLSQPPASR